MHPAPTRLTCSLARPPRCRCTCRCLLLCPVESMDPSLDFLKLGTYDALYSHYPPVIAHVLKARPSCAAVGPPACLPCLPACLPCLPACLPALPSRPACWRMAHPGAPPARPLCWPLPLRFLPARCRASWCGTPRPGCWMGRPTCSCRPWSPAPSRCTPRQPLAHAAPWPRGRPLALLPDLLAVSRRRGWPHAACPLRAVRCVPAAAAPPSPPPDSIAQSSPAGPQCDLSPIDQEWYRSLQVGGSWGGLATGLASQGPRGTGTPRHRYF